MAPRHKNEGVHLRGSAVQVLHQRCQLRLILGLHHQASGLHPIFECHRHHPVSDRRQGRPNFPETGGFFERVTGFQYQMILERPAPDLQRRG